MPINFDPSPTKNAYQKILNFARETDDQLLSEAIKKSINVIEECFTRYQPENVSVCFNGGKDCVVMLHLVHAVHQNLFPEKKLKSFYVSEKKTFSELDDFIEKTIESYELKNKTYEEPMKAALGHMLSDDKDVLVTLLGVRHGDPGESDMLTIEWRCLKT